jgi:hypothetical protein
MVIDFKVTYFSCSMGAQPDLSPLERVSFTNFRVIATKLNDNNFIIRSYNLRS